LEPKQRVGSDARRAIASGSFIQEKTDWQIGQKTIPRVVAAGGRLKYRRVTFRRRK